MKKVLLASTALVMTAGMGYAQVSQGIAISGYAEIGIKDLDDDNDVRFHNDLDLTFTYSGETDAGLAFGATIDIDEFGDGFDDDDNEFSAFVSYNGIQFKVGDQDGALDLVNLETTFLTTLEDDHTAHGGFFGAGMMDEQLDGQIGVLSYSGVPGLLVAASLEINDDDADPFNINSDPDGLYSELDDTWAVGIRYTTDINADWEVSGSLAYQEGAYAFDTAGLGDADGNITLPTGLAVTDTWSQSAELWAISLEAEHSSGFTGRLNFSELEGDVDAYQTSCSGPAADVAACVSATVGQQLWSPEDADTALTGNGALIGQQVEWEHWGIGLLYETGAWGFEFNYGEYDGSLAGLDFDSDGFGIAINYDLGGGAALALGYGSGDANFFSDEDVDTWSFGMFMSF